MKERVPLSWFHKKIDFPKFHWIKLTLSGVPWIYSADVPSTYNLNELYAQLETEFPTGFLLRGCSSEFAKYFGNKGCEIVRTGAEAVVDLDNITNVSKSVLDLVDRGSKWGSVKEVQLNQANCKRVNQFMQHTPYGTKPKLSYLFNNTFDSNTRCFVVRSNEDRWLGVLTISKASKDSCHTEMILRNKNAPVGVMEFLIYSVMKRYRDECYKSFSLGEVPFVSPAGIEEITPSIKRIAQENLVFKIGHLIRYAFDYKGLYDFKNKFNPTWKPVYLCATPKLKFRSLLDLFCETGCLKLSSSELLSTIKFYS